jgi:hypothetical protein
MESLLHIILQYHIQNEIIRIKKIVLTRQAFQLAVDCTGNISGDLSMKNV